MSRRLDRRHQSDSTVPRCDACRASTRASRPGSLLFAYFAPYLVETSLVVAETQRTKLKFNWDIE